METIHSMEEINYSLNIYHICSQILHATHTTLDEELQPETFQKVRESIYFFNCLWRTCSVLHKDNVILDSFCILNQEFTNSFLKDLHGSCISSHYSLVKSKQTFLQTFQFPFKFSKCIISISERQSSWDLITSYIADLLISILLKCLKHLS